MSIQPQDLSPEQRAELGIDEDGHRIDPSPEEAAAKADAIARLEELDAREAASAELEEAELNSRAGRPSTDPEERKRPQPTSEDPARALLELNGYNAIRTQLLGIIGQANSLPPDAIDAAITFAERARARLRVSTDPRAKDGLNRVDGELELFRAVRHLAKRLDELEQRHAARDAITAR